MQFRHSWLEVPGYRQIGGDALASPRGDGGAAQSKVPANPFNLSRNMPAERSYRTQEVGGSSPPSSTILTKVEPAQSQLGLGLRLLLARIVSVG